MKAPGGFSRICTLNPEPVTLKNPKPGSGFRISLVDCWYGMKKGKENRKSTDKARVKSIDFRLKCQVGSRVGF